MRTELNCQVDIRERLIDNPIQPLTLPYIPSKVPSFLKTELDLNQGPINRHPDFTFNIKCSLDKTMHCSL